MLEITIKDSDIAKIAEKAGGQISSVLGKAVMAGAEIIKKEASAKASRGKTGNLASTMQAVLSEETVQTATATVKPKEFYGRFLERGTKPHIINLKNKKILTNRQDFFGMSVKHPGIRKRPFLQPAEEAKRNDAEQAIERVIFAALGGG